MASDSRYIPSQHWYGSQTPDRSAVGQKKIDELQRQIVTMQNDMRNDSALLHKLNRLKVIEDEKREVEDKVLERNSRSNTPRLLQSEMERLYGRESQIERNNSPGLDKHVVETVIQHRTKEFSQKQQEAALKAKYLDKERQRLVEARRRVEEQRRALLNTMSPTGKEPFSFHNDKVYMSYQPYHFFENRKDRIRDSLVLPVTKEFPKADSWKLKIKFVPMSIEDCDTWNKYEKQMTKEREPDVDEAVKAFQSFTQNKKRSQKRAHHKVRYFPQYTPGDFPTQYTKHRSHTLDPLKDFLWKSKTKHLGFARSFDDFRDSLKFVAMHDGYRRKRKELNRINRQHEEFETIQNMRKNYNYGKDYFPRKLKVKFRPAATYREPYRHKYKSMSHTY